MASLFDAGPKPVENGKAATGSDQADPSTERHKETSSPTANSPAPFAFLNQPPPEQPNDNAGNSPVGATSASTDTRPSAPARSGIYSHDDAPGRNLSDASIVGSAKQSVTFTRPPLDRKGTSEDIVVHAQQPSSIYSRITGMRNQSEASVTTASRSNRADVHSSEALVGPKEPGEKSRGGLFGGKRKAGSKSKKSRSKNGRGKVVGSRFHRGLTGVLFSWGEEDMEGTVRHRLRRTHDDRNSRPRNNRRHRPSFLPSSYRYSFDRKSGKPVLGQECQQRVCSRRCPLPWNCC